MIKLSLIIPVYNEEKCLADCLDSIAAQTAILRLEEINLNASVLNFLGIVAFLLGIFFVLYSLKHINAIGIDIKYDQDAEKGLNYKEETFDYITLLAVIEHFHDYRKVIKDCHRVLKNNGLLIMTTPFRKTERFIRLYQKGDIGHIGYFSRKDFNRLNKFRLIHYSTFEFGLNQLIVLKKG